MTTPQQLSTSAVEMRLRDAGFSDDTTAHLVPKFEEVVEALHSAAGAGPVSHLLFVPGRIEVLGKHTDYAGGSSLTCATERGFCLGVIPSDEPTLSVQRVATGETVRLDLTETDAPPGEHWATYPMAVVRRVRQNFDVELNGGHVAFTSTLPQAAGMSSSSAMIVAFFEILRLVNGLGDHPLYRQHLRQPEARAEYMGAIESGKSFGSFGGETGVGTFGGSQDHTAILCSAPGRLRQFGYRPTRRLDEVPLPDGYAFVIGDSGVVAEKTGAQRDRYNRASQLAERAAVAWRNATGRDDPHFGAAVGGEGFASERMREVLRADDGPFDAEDLVRRFDHFYTEHCKILPEAVEALREEDMQVLGDVVHRSQEAAEELLGNQVPETSFLARSARELGAVAASAFGAGFGGSVWALVRETDASTFCEEWATRYEKEFPEPARNAQFFVERTGPAAFEL